MKKLFFLLSIISAPTAFALDSLQGIVVLKIRTSQPTPKSAVRHFYTYEFVTATGTYALSDSNRTLHSEIESTYLNLLVGRKILATGAAYSQNGEKIFSIQSATAFRETTLHGKLSREFSVLGTETRIETDDGRAVELVRTSDEISFKGHKGDICTVHGAFNRKNHFAVSSLECAESD